MPNIRYLLAILAIGLLTCLSFGQPQQYLFTNYNMTTGLTNAVYFGSPSMPAQDGWVIQILCAGADGSIQPPVLSGANKGLPTGDDFLADPVQNYTNTIYFDQSTVGAPGAFFSAVGMQALTAGTGTEPVINLGDIIYLRAFDSSSWTTAGFYADLIAGDMYTAGSQTGSVIFVDDLHFTGQLALPVEMLSFSANPGNNFVTLDWATASETENDHFNIYRDDVKIAQIPSRNLSGEAVETAYNFKDEQVTNGINYLYEITAVDINGEETEALYNMEVIPSWDPDYVVTDYMLHQNYPNPFNPGTTIEYDVLESGKVYLSVYNITGQEVAKIINGEYRVGPLKHVSFFNADGLSSGIYFYQVRVNDFKSTKKMVLVR